MGVGGRIDQLARRVHLVADARKAQNGIRAEAANGKIVASGSFEELIATSPGFKKLVELERSNLD